jgi:hypothetical protein
MMFSNAENFITCETLDAAAQPKSAQAGASSAIRVSRKTPNRSGGNNPPATDENLRKSPPPIFLSGAEEHKPDYAQDQDRQTGGRQQEGKHRRPGLCLTHAGRSFDDPTLLSICHADLDFPGRPRRSVAGRLIANA